MGDCIGTLPLVKTCLTGNLFTGRSAHVGAEHDMGLERGSGQLVSAVLGAPIVAFRHLTRRWWARSPYLPRFSQPHLAWRRATAYGSSEHPVDGGDLIAYLAWVRRYGRAIR